MLSTVVASAPSQVVVEYHYRWFGPEFFVTVALIVLLVLLVLLVRWCVRFVRRAMSSKAPPDVHP